MERSDASDAIEAAKDGRDSDDLQGECPYNAKRLYDELTERGVTAHIIRGACELPHVETPETIEEAEDEGIVHWWVEARIDDTWMTIDLSSELPSQLGSPIYRSNRPSEYVPFEIDPDAVAFAER